MPRRPPPTQHTTIGGLRIRRSRAFSSPPWMRILHASSLAASRRRRYGRPSVPCMFGAQSRANVRHIRRQLQTLRKEELSAAKYIHKMKALAVTMVAAGSPIRDDELIDHILTGLGSAYNSIAASRGVSNAPMPYSSFYSLVLSFEALQAQQSAAEGWSPSANTVTRSGSYGTRRRAPYSEPYPSHGGGRPGDGNGQPGQGREGGNDGTNGGRDRNPGYACNGRQGGGGNAGNNDGGGRRNTRWRPRCQICKNWGHEADECRKRYDQDHNTCSANSASTSTVDYPWVHECYDGKDQVQVANGAAVITLNHKGSILNQNKIFH
nr:glycine, alanine and asparagine-rich protein-like [Aegilops tauschii subsp. strangulata]